MRSPVQLTPSWPPLTRAVRSTPAAGVIAGGAGAAAGDEGAAGSATLGDPVGGDAVTGLGVELDLLGCCDAVGVGTEAPSDEGSGSLWSASRPEVSGAATTAEPFDEAETTTRPALLITTHARAETLVTTNSHNAKPSTTLRALMPMAPLCQTMARRRV